MPRASMSIFISIPASSFLETDFVRSLQLLALQLSLFLIPFAAWCREFFSSAFEGFPGPAHVTMITAAAVLDIAPAVDSCYTKLRNDGQTSKLVGLFPLYFLFFTVWKSVSGNHTIPTALASHRCLRTVEPRHLAKCTQLRLYLVTKDTHVRMRGGIFSTHQKIFSDTKKVLVVKVWDRTNGGWVILERTWILSGIQFTTHFIEIVVVETKRSSVVL